MPVKGNFHTKHKMLQLDKGQVWNQGRRIHTQCVRVCFGVKPALRRFRACSSVTMSRSLWAQIRPPSQAGIPLRTGVPIPDPPPPSGLDTPASRAADKNELVWRASPHRLLATRGQHDLSLLDIKRRSRFSSFIPGSVPFICTRVLQSSSVLSNQKPVCLFITRPVLVDIS